MRELCYLTAVEALERFKDKTLSPVELMEAVIARSEQMEPQINAFSFTYFEEAMEAAKVAEQRYAAGTERPLEGIPLAVKDESYIAGMPTRMGHCCCRISYLRRRRQSFRLRVIRGRSCGE